MSRATSLQAYFSHLPDPREEAKREHQWWDIVMIAICAVIRIAESCEDMALLRESKQVWLKQWLQLPNSTQQYASERCWLLPWKRTGTSKEHGL
jgi:hypothetical protein